MRLAFNHVRARLEVRRLDRVRQNRACVNIRLVGHVRPNGFREAPHAEFADRVRRHERLTDLPDYGTDVDQHSRALPPEHGKHDPRSIHRAKQICFNDTTVQRVVAVIEQCEQRRACIIDPYVDPAPCRERRISQSIEIGFACDISRDRERVASRSTTLRCHIRKQMPAPRGKDDAAAMPRKVKRSRTPDAARRAGHHDNPIA